MSSIKKQLVSNISNCYGAKWKKATVVNFSNNDRGGKSLQWNKMFFLKPYCSTASEYYTADSTNSEGKKPTQTLTLLWFICIAVEKPNVLA